MQTQSANVTNNVMFPPVALHTGIKYIHISKYFNKKLQRRLPISKQIFECLQRYVSDENSCKNQKNLY